MLGWKYKNQDDSNTDKIFKVALDGVQTAIMMVDRDLNITYVNHGTRKLLRDNAESFQKIWPAFDPEHIIGQCIDQFHKDPSHQRRLLANPGNLPYQADISVGELKFSLTVTAQMDAQGHYIGNTLEWCNVTELRKHEEANAKYKSIIEAINREQAVIEFDMSGNIIHANDNFLNLTEYSLDQIVGKHHSIFVEQEYINSEEYQAFWMRLQSGKFNSGEYSRLGNNNKKIWIQATYSPITDANGNYCNVIKIASDITETKQRQEIREQVLHEAKSVMGDIAKGNLTNKMSEYSHEDFKELGISINTCIDKLTEVVDKIKSSTNTLNSGIAEISSGNVNLSNLTEEQAKSLEQTSHSMEEITSTVKNNAENAQHARKLAGTTREHATHGGDVVNQAVNAMEEISNSSMRIADIIGVIDEIAFQTNLLALNAAVEAARAGEQGRGFAVVASEVRNLAGRSAKAAKEIKSLIEDSVKKVAQGTTLVNDSGKTLKKIVGSVKEVSELIDDIADASEDQANGLDTINSSVNEIDTTTQKNAALVEESAASSEMMSQQAEELYKLVGYFKTTNSDSDNSLTNDSLDDFNSQTVERRSTTRPWSPSNSKVYEEDPLVNTWQEF